MAKDLVARLRKIAGHELDHPAAEAADEIERLTQELGETKVKLIAESFALESAGRNYAILEDNAERLRAALQQIAKPSVTGLVRSTGDLEHIAREALRGTVEARSDST